MIQRYAASLKIIHHRRSITNSLCQNALTVSSQSPRTALDPTALTKTPTQPSLAQHFEPETMLNYIYHPAGPVVIRTTNPTITFSYQDRGWLTTQYISDILRDHPEWQSTLAPPAPTPTNAPGDNIATCLGSAILSSLSATMAIIPSYAPTGVGAMAPIIVDNYGRGSTEQRQQRELISNSAPMHWMTAVERSWYQDRGLPIPVTEWLGCNHDETLKYRLVSGELDLEVPPPQYDVQNYM